MGKINGGIGACWDCIRLVWLCSFLYFLLESLSSLWDLRLSFTPAVAMVGRRVLTHRFTYKAMTFILNFAKTIVHVTSIQRIHTWLINWSQRISQTYHQTPTTPHNINNVKAIMHLNKIGLFLWWQLWKSSLDVVDGVMQINQNFIDLRTLTSASRKVFLL